ncbi:heme peroxidase [Mycolicibacterium farcinogenes]|nr:heme peroxidase [Mycolicibacterium farcinogenes]
MHSDVEKLHTACVRDLGDHRRWFSPRGYPDSLALCVIDSIYSTGARYATVEKITARYRDYRAGQGADADQDGAAELLRTIVELNGPDAWAERIGNRRPTSTAANAPLKSVAVAQVAKALVGIGICSADDLRSAVRDDARRAAARTAWCDAPGQKSGVTWDYALKLAQIPGTRAGRVVAAYVAREIGPVSAEDAGEVLRGVAQTAGWSALALDHAIWRFESGYPYQRDLALSA